MQQNKKRSIYEMYIKRSLDFICALFAVFILGPLMLMLAIMVKVKLGSPVIFKQERPGLNEKIFVLYKFRTMNEKKDKTGVLLPDHIRLTKFGEFLRSTSLDELPELINILKGDMSFCGPRPLLVQYLSLYNKKQQRRHLVRPGLTGYAQVNGRNAISWEQKFAMDVYYVDHVSFLGDMRILVKTIYKVLLRENINSKNYATMEPFSGSPKCKG